MTETIIKQNNMFTNGRYNITSAELNIIFLLLYHMNKCDFQQLSYEFDFSELRKYSDETINYSHIKEACNRLIDRSFEYTYTGNTGSDVWCKVHFISSVKIVKSGRVKIGVDETIMEHYKFVNSFTIYQLETAIRLKSKYAKRIYQLLSMWKSTKKYIVNYDELRSILGIPPDEYAKQNDFTRFILNASKHELDEIGDISFDYEPLKKSGKSIVVFQFNIIERHKNNVEKTVNHELVERLYNEANLSQWQIEQVLTYVSEKDILKTLYDLQVSNRDIKNIGAYAAKTFSKNFNLNIYHEKNEQKAAN